MSCFASFANQWLVRGLVLLYRKARKERRQERKAKLRTIALRPLRILGVLRGEVLLTAKLAPDCRQERKAKPRVLCILCESLAFFAVKFFFTAKLAKNCHQERKAKPTHQVKLSLY